MLVHERILTAMLMKASAHAQRQPLTGVTFHAHQDMPSMMLYAKQCWLPQTLHNGMGFNKSSNVAFTVQERKRAAMMLSQLPADIDIAMLLQPETTTSNSTPQKARKGNAVVPSSGVKSVRVD